MKIVELKAANLKRLSAVEIRPDGSLVVIGGNNGAGKSSVLDSILYALGGAGELPGVPVRNGEKKASIELRIDSTPPMIVRRRITAEGKTSLEITTTGKDGIESKVSSPQSILNHLCGKIAFDPLAFTRLAPHGQAGLLREVVGIDLGVIDDHYKAAFEARASHNRETRRLDGELTGVIYDSDAPAELVDTAKLMASLDLIGKANAAHEERQLAAAKAANDVADRKRYLEQAEREVELCETALTEAKADVEVMAARLEDSNENQHQRQQFADSSSLTDNGEIRQQIANADSVNELVRANQRHQTLKASRDQSKYLADGQTERLDELKDERIAKMGAAKWPVEGLGFNDLGVTYQDLPFEQCSSAEQLRISTAIGLAQHPKLKVLLIRDGSLLDEQSLAAIGELAAEHDAQIWIERVGHGEECSVIIEDGAIAVAESVTEADEELATA